MTFFKKFHISMPVRTKRMEKLETLSLGPSQYLHLVRVDGQDYIVLLGGGHSTILPKPAPLKEMAQ
jgi:hypothetical protein